MRLVERQQRALYRAQERSLRRRSLLGPVLLVGLGATLLFVEGGHLQAAVLLAWLGHWWPLLLLVSGLIRLAEWTWDIRLGSNSAGSGIPRRRLGMGSLLLIFLVVAVGLVGHILPQGLDWARQSGNSSLIDALRLDRLLAQHAEERSNLHAPLARGTMFTVQNDAGSITISGDSQDGQVHIVADQHLAGWQTAELEEHRQRDRPVLRQTADGLLLTVAAEDRDRTDLSIEVPHETAVSIQGGQGDLNLSELHAPVVISGHQGSIGLTALAGAVTVMSQDQDAAITGHSLSGDIKVEGRAGDLDFSDLSGSLHLQGDFFGNTHLERILAPVHFKSSFTDLACGGIPGDLQIEGRSELEAHNVTGPFVLSTSGRNLTLEDLHGATTVTNHQGAVHLTLAGPLAPVNVNTSDAELEVSLPEGLGFHLDAVTTKGELTTDFALPRQQHGERTAVSGPVLTAGPEIRLATSQANLHVRRLDRDGDEDNQNAADTKVNSRQPDSDD